MMDKTLEALRKLADNCTTLTTEDKDTELYEEVVGVICNELWELGILLNKLRLGFKEVKKQ